MNYWYLIAILFGALLGYAAGIFLRKRSQAAAGAAATSSATLSATKVVSIYTIAEGLREYYEQSVQPKELLTHETFKQGVELLSRDSCTTKDLLAYAVGKNAIISCLALEALAKRSDEIELLDPILKSINDFSYRQRDFAFRLLDARVAQPLLGAVLARIDTRWMQDEWLEPPSLQALKDLAARRIEKGETPTFGAQLTDMTTEQADLLEKIINELGEGLTGSLADEWQQWRRTRVDLNFLKAIGRVWGQEDRAENEVLLEHSALLDHVAELEAVLLKTPRRSVLLVGESGVGKTALVRVLAKRLQAQGWTIFEASASDLNAGQMYIGQLEERIQTLIRQIGGARRVLWVAPNFHELAWAGRHRYSPTGMLDMLAPYIERGEIMVIGETQPRAYEQLIQSKPRLRITLDIHRLNPLSDEQTLEMARQWAEQSNSASETPLLTEQTRQEAFQLAKQYLGEKAAPGNLLQFLKLTRQRLIAANPSASVTISRDDLLVTLAQLTGLPTSILDDRQGLDLEGLREFFQQRVLGQPEAIDCLVERVAMIKAGVTDPTRPQGVFLFAGPTGTGKTEIAKSLAQFLFGSPERMIRLDMSEFQTTESLGRILGEAEEMPSHMALVNLIRHQPFSVVLLDEFEKANPQVWDLFLQVFDDGRLTDRRGNTADFRHCIIIMTSNLGATLPRGTSVGFQDRASFTLGSVERAITAAFRREFLNRIDRIVVFRPLSRTVMRELLRKELSEIFHRRGLRHRAWAVEWDESAIEFLLEKGFTADLGARPLKRAAERYLLSPLAMTIVNHQFPAGDQFLFVRSDGRQIEVEFVDPDAPEREAETAAITEVADHSTFERVLQLEEIALDAAGTLAEAEFLQQRYQRLVNAVEVEAWQQRKQAALAQTALPGFWESPERFSILGAAEFMDRIEAGLRTAGSLLRRLTGSQPRDRQHFSHDLMRRLARQIYLLDAACAALAAGRPRDAFLLVEGGGDSSAEIGANNVFAQRLGNMYQQWAAKRGMSLELLEETNGDQATSYRLLMAVSGYAAFSILEAEAGLHIFETPQHDKSFHRSRARVRVAAMPDTPAGPSIEAVRTQAWQALAQMGEAPLVIVRRYREEPSPLVRDSVRQWRTGRLDRVFGGDFDLIV